MSSSKMSQDEPKNGLLMLYEAAALQEHVTTSALQEHVTTSALQEHVTTSALQEHVTTSALQKQNAVHKKVQPFLKNIGRPINDDHKKNLTKDPIQLTHVKKRCRSIPNHLITEYTEYTSDELSKKFSYKCKFAPNFCSEVEESYGNERKAFFAIKRHIEACHPLRDKIPECVKKTKRDLTESSSNQKLSKLKLSVDLLQCEPSKIVDPPKRFRSVKTAESVFTMEFNGAKSFPQQPTEYASFIIYNRILNTIKGGEFEHTYSKNRDELSNAIPPAGQKKNRRQNIGLPVNQFDLNKHLNADSHYTRPIIHTPPFPFIYTAYPLEAACNVELDSNGDPVVVKEPIFAKPSTSIITSKNAMGNKVSRKKIKFVPTVNSTRSILECVENRVACKNNASSEQKDGLLPDDSIENLENVGKSIYEIARKNILILCEQRRKRKYRDKPTAYICEICHLPFTASTSLIYHYMGHLNMKPFKCDICDRTFTRQHSLNYHLMIHADQNRFQCETCKRLFRHPSHFKEHVRKHNDEEPYSCKFCSNKFKARNAFKRHLKTQHQQLLTSNGIEPIRSDS